ncbi:MAG: DUF4147 domain-containing protein [Planctomycetota bacterium]
MSSRSGLQVDDFVRQVTTALHPSRHFTSNVTCDREHVAFRGQRLEISDARGITILGLGKASVEQTAALYDLLRQQLGSAIAIPRPLAVTKSGLHAQAEEIEIVTGSHPLCDRSSLDAGQRLRAAFAAIPRDHVAILCLSGGGSALAVEPIAEVALEEKIAINAELLRIGAPIEPTNRIRQELSRLKNGGLLPAFGGLRLSTWATVDIPSQDPRFVASAPTHHVPRDPSQCLDDATRWLPAEHAILIERVCTNPQRAERQRALAEASRRISSSLVSCGDWTSLANLTRALLMDAGMRTVHIEPVALDATIDEGLDHVLERLESLRDLPRPLALVSGGELGVRVGGAGRGGRNSAFVVAMARALFFERRTSLPSDQLDSALILSLATDGSDGNTEHAGGWLDRSHLSDSGITRRELDDAIANSDTHSFLARRGTSIRTGATGTNLMDLRIVALGE